MEHVNNAYEQFKREASLLPNRFSALQLSEDGDGVPVLTGLLLLTGDDDEQIDSYKLRIVCPQNYPQSFPLVYEEGGRIPVNIDWHVHADGRACICSHPDEIVACHKGIELCSFIDEWVKPYFFNQKYREMHGFFLKERAHGHQGNIDFFVELFKTKNLQNIAQWIFYINANPEPNRANNCFCGSNQKYRRCHRDAYRLLKPLGSRTLESFAQFLLRHPQKGGSDH